MYVLIPDGYVLGAILFSAQYLDRWSKVCRLQQAGSSIAAEAAQPPSTGDQSGPQPTTRSQIRGYVYVVLSELKHVELSFKR